MVVEVLAPTRLAAQSGDGTGGFWIGSNDAGQTDPTDIRADFCAAPDYVDAAAFAPDMHMVMRVDGGPYHYAIVTVENDTGQNAADLHLRSPAPAGRSSSRPRR